MSDATLSENRPIAKVLDEVGVGKGRPRAVSGLPTVREICPLGAFAAITAWEQIDQTNPGGLPKEEARQRPLGTQWGRAPWVTGRDEAHERVPTAANRRRLEDFFLADVANTLPICT